MKTRKLISLLPFLAAAVPGFAADAVQLCPLSEVRLTKSSVFAPAVKAGVSYVKELDADMSLTCCRCRFQCQFDRFRGDVVE